MYDIDALEAINIDQLVTATDKLLLRCKRTIQRPGSRSTVDFSREAAAALAASVATSARSGRLEDTVVEQTVFVREASHRRHNLLGAVALITGAWLGVVCACLLT
jgi:hypothetical protein